MTMDFELKVSAKDMSKFLLRFNYTKLSGMLGILLGFASLAALIIRWGAWSDNQKIMLVVIAFLFLIFQPFLLIRNSQFSLQKKDVSRLCLTAKRICCVKCIFLTETLYYHFRFLPFRNVTNSPKFRSIGRGVFHCIISTSTGLRM